MDLSTKVAISLFVSQIALMFLFGWLLTFFPKRKNITRLVSRLVIINPFFLCFTIFWIIWN